MGARSPREPFRSCSGAASQVLADLGSGRSRRPGAAPAPHPGRVSLGAAAEAQPRFSPGWVSAPGPATTEISHDPLPPTVRSGELQGLARPDSEAAERRDDPRMGSRPSAWNPHPPLFSVPRGTCWGASHPGHPKPWSSGAHSHGGDCTWGTAFPGTVVPGQAPCSRPWT